MKKININLGYKKYSIIIDKGILSSISSAHKLKFANSKAFIITDKNVSKLYLKTIIASFNKKKIHCFNYTISVGEKSKSFEVLQKLSNKILKDKINRNDVIYALGGGIVGDLAGFLSSIILRGVRYVQIPTTLLSQVDSSVGGKTAINTSVGKNLIGTFCQPDFVYIDTNTLKSLSNQEYLAGYAEVIKYGVINDKAFFNWLNLNYKKIKNRNNSIINELIYRCCKNKAKIVADDERESGKRMLLNLGHTFAHAIEAELNFSIKHGQAVAVGILMSLHLSVTLGYSNTQDFLRILEHLKKMSLPTKLKDLSSKKNWAAKNLINKMQNDKKIINNKLKFILCKGIGNAFISDKVTNANIIKTINLLT